MSNTLYAASLFPEKYVLVPTRQQKGLQFRLEERVLSASLTSGNATDVSWRGFSSVDQSAIRDHPRLPVSLQCQEAKFRSRMPKCCVEAECHFCYLEDSGLYVHESCCPGNQRHLPTYVGCRRFWYGPLTKDGS